jgi:hypothetical protein
MMDTVRKANERRAAWVEAKRRERAQREASERDGSARAYADLCAFACAMDKLELKWP